MADPKPKPPPPPPPKPPAPETPAPETPPEMPARRPLPPSGPREPGLDPLAHARQLQLPAQEPADEAALRQLLPAESGPEWARAEAFLAGAGWRRVGLTRTAQVLWLDPLGEGARGGTKVAVRLPARDGGTETVWQQTLPAASWQYPTAEAVALQLARMRPEAGRPLLETLERKRRARQALDQEIRALEEQAAPEAGQPPAA